MKITGLVLTLNEMFYIRASLHNATRHCHHVIVLDGGSTDGTEKYLAEVAEKDSRVTYISKPQKVRRMYDDSWDQSGRLNLLIDMSSTDWVFLLGADECLSDSANLSTLALSGLSSAYRFPRYSLFSRKAYAPTWFPDSQLRLFDRTAYNGVRFPDGINRHCLPTSDMGDGETIPAHVVDDYLVHYHHGFGPKKCRPGPGMELAPIPRNFKHSTDAQTWMLDREYWPEDFRYEFGLYGNLPGRTGDYKK